MFDIDSQWQVILVDLHHLSQWNQGYIQVFTDLYRCPFQIRVGGALEIENRSLVGGDL